MLFRSVDVHVVSVIITYDFYRCVALVAQIFASPLGESVAGDAVSVAVGGKDRLAHARARQVVREDGVHDAADIFVYVPAADPFLVVGC